MPMFDKLGSLISRPNDEAKDDVPWWLKYAGRIAGTVGGAFAIFFGVWMCTEIIFGAVQCFLGGIWQMVAGFFVIVVEAPCCCMFIDFVQKLSEQVDKRPYWNRGLVYCVIGLPPIFLCFSFSSLLGSGAIFATGVIYGFMALGRKGTETEMRNNAMDEMGIQNHPPMSTSMKSPLTVNAQGIAFDSPA